MQAAILLKVREREKVTIGRNTAEIPPNKIQINSQYISSRHCQIIPENGKLILTDSSRNGTWVSSTNPGSVVSSEVKTSTPSIHIKSIYSIRNKTVPLEPNTYIIFIPPNLSKLPNEIVGLHFTGLDPAREFYHLECIKHNSMLENRQLMTFFSHMGFGKDYHNGFSSIVSTDMAMQTRKRMHPRSEEVGRVLSLGKSAAEFGCKVDDGVVCKTLKFASEEEDVFKKSPKDCENSPPSKSAKVELEQCQFCLKDFPVLELIDHSEECKIETEKITISDKGETCFASLKHSSKFKLGKEKSIENCMKCFKEFPLSELIQHSENCKGDLLSHGDEERFKHFIPSALDIDAISCCVLNDRQQRAVEYVLHESKVSSDKIYPYLKCRVRHLGYQNADLDKTLHWIRYEAPIIIHLNLDRALNFLVKDTHYRNRFETGTSGGCLDTSVRSSWEDRIFNSIYSKAPAVDRVKYGVLNIVGDACGVKACYGYGDSFLQLKKVRLRTTFASADTSMATVKLSCCEHYVNVMNEYSESELKAILDVATRRVQYHDSSVISTYKEVQIHGPVSLSDNVECIVVNQRHRTDKKINKLLQKFIDINKCNLIWMDQV